MNLFLRASVRAVVQTIVGALGTAVLIGLLTLGWAIGIEFFKKPGTYLIAIVALLLIIGLVYHCYEMGRLLLPLKPKRRPR